MIRQVSYYYKIFVQSGGLQFETPALPYECLGVLCVVNNTEQISFFFLTITRRNNDSCNIRSVHVNC